MIKIMIHSHSIYLWQNQYRMSEKLQTGIMKMPWKGK